MIPIARPIIGEDEKRRVMEVMDSGIITTGKVVEEFERKFAAHHGCAYGVATSSGTTALQLSIKTAGIGFGDKVLTTPFTFIATANALLFNGANPVFCDIDPDTFNISPASIRAALETVPDIKAILIVHLYGLPCEMGEIMDIVKERGLILLEDCAQAHGATYDGRFVGGFGTSSAFSFYPTKNMTTGEGGMVLTNSEEINKALRLLREHGDAGGYNHQILGFNFRMTNIEAAIGLAQLEKLNAFNAKRIENARYYYENLKGIEWLSLPVIPPKCHHVFHQFTLKVRDRDNFAGYLQENGIGCKIYYPSTIYEQPLYVKLGFTDMHHPNAEAATREVVSIPVHPALSEQDRERIAKTIREYKIAKP